MPQGAGSARSRTGTWCVLDSYAVLALLGRERGWRKVRTLLGEAAEGRRRLLISVVNLGEVLYVVERARGLADTYRTLARIVELPIETLDAGRDLALSAAHLKARFPIAYADCFAAALALESGAPLVTGDPEFHLLEDETPLEIMWLD